VTRLARLLRTTAFKLSLAYLVLTACVAAVMIAIITRETNRILTEQIEATLDVEISALDGVYQAGGIIALARAVDRRASQPGSNLYLVTTPLGEPIAGNVGTIEPGVLDRDERREVEYVRDDDATRTRRALVRVMVLPSNFRLLVGRDLEEQDRFQTIVGQTTAVAALAMLVLGLGGGWFVASRIARRIDGMTDTSRSIMAGDLTRRLPLAGSDDEFDRLAASVNAMLARIEELMRGLKEVSDDIAHDLKTPLTRLRTRAEAALRGTPTADELKAVLQQTVEETDGLIRTFEALLTIARVDSGAGKETFQAVDVHQLVTSVADLYEAVAEANGLQLILEIGPSIETVGNRELLAQAVANLVDNAIKYAEGASDPTVCIAATRTKQGIEIIVSDRGPGIPEDDRKRVTERFVRLEASRSRPGSGLGLALVAAIARLHGGTLTFEDNTPGLRARLCLP
jgi:signal transduction histidine kinase